MDVGLARSGLAPEQCSPQTRGPGGAGPCTPASAPSDPELAKVDAIYGYSFILTNLDVSAPDKAAAAEHWYGTARPSRTSSGQQARRRPPAPALWLPQVNMAWMRGALLAASIAAWLHQLTTATPAR